MRLVYGYLRASTDRQDASVPAQRKCIEDFCRREDWQVVDWFSDDGVSGKSFERPDYRRMRALILGGNPDQVEHIVVWSFSRFARVDADDFIVEKRALARAGVTIASATEGIRGDRGMGNDLLGYISAYQNREFLVKLSKDVTRGMRALVENGFWPSLAPLGYDRLVVDGQHNPIVVNGQPLILKRGQLKGSQNHVILVPGSDHEQSAVRLMFDRRGNHRWGLRRIAAELNEMESRTINGKPWKHTTIRSCLTNLTYVGHTRYGVRRKHAGIRNQIEGTKLSRNPLEEWITIERTHEALIPASLFEKVTASLDGNRRPVARSHTVGRRLMLFSSAITCKHCEANYQCRPRRKNGKVYEYYECYGPSSGQTSLDCDCWSLNVEKLKTFIFGEISKRVSDEAIQAAMKGYLVGRLGQLLRGTVLNTEDLERQVSELTRKKSRIIDSIADGMVPRGDATVTTKLREIDDQLLLLTARLEEIEGVRRTQLDPDLIATRLVERVRNLTGFLESHRVEDQRKALFAFCKRIVADAMAREVVIETDLIGLAQLPGMEELPVGTPMDVVAALGAQENAQPAEGGGLCNWTLPE